MKESKLLLKLRIIILLFFSLSLYFNLSESESINNKSVVSCKIKQIYLRTGRRNNSSILVEYSGKDYFIGIPRKKENIFEILKVGDNYNFYLNKKTRILFIEDNNRYRLTVFIGLIFVLTYIPMLVKLIKLPPSSTKSTFTSSK